MTISFPSYFEGVAKMVQMGTACSDAAHVSSVETAAGLKHAEIVKSIAAKIDFIEATLRAYQSFVPRLSPIHQGRLDGEFIRRAIVTALKQVKS